VKLVVGKGKKVKNLLDKNRNVDRNDKYGIDERVSRMLLKPAKYCGLNRISEQT